MTTKRSTRKTVRKPAPADAHTRYFRLEYTEDQLDLCDDMPNGGRLYDAVDAAAQYGCTVSMRCTDTLETLGWVDADGTITWA